MDESLQQRIFSIERPDSSLMVYYLLTSLLAGPFFFIPLLPLSFRYNTLRYRFDDEGISMRWGVLFRREIHLTYARIQDIHLTSNIIERWLGLARIQVQTASGSAKAEMTVEGVKEFEQVRDFIYSRMRGLRGPAPAPPGGPAGATAGPAVDSSDELAAVLREVVEEIRSLRTLLERRG